MTQGLKKYENQVSKAVKKPTLNPYNNQPIQQKLSPITPLVKKSVEQVLKPIGISTKPAQDSSKGIFTDVSTPNAKAPVTPSNQATAPKIEMQPVQVSKFEPQKVEPKEVSKPDFYGVQTEHKVYDPYKSAKRIEDLDPETQAVIKKTFSKENLFGEDGFEYNMERVANAVATLPNKMVQTVGFIANLSKRITEYIPGNTFLKSKDVLELEEKGLEAFRETQIIRDRSQQIQQKYENKIGAIPQFTSDVLTNAIDMIPTIIATKATGGMAGMAQMFFSAGAQAEKEALDSGAEADEAFVYGTLIGGIEAGTEMIFGTLGGIKLKNMPAWSNVLSNKFKEVLADVSKTPIAKAFVSNLVDVAGEGFEEVVAEVLGNYAKLVYTDQIKSGQELTNDALYAGLLGMFSAGFMRTTQIATIRGLEVVANTGSIQKMSYEQSVTLSSKLADKLNYNFELISEEQAIEKYGKDESVKKTIAEGGRAFVVKEATENGRLGNIVVVDRGSKSNVLATSVLHEVTHVLEDTATYNQLIALVKQRLGDERYKQYVDNYAQAYEVDAEARYRSGIRISESEFIAQKIIQEQLFGLDGNMRTSFIMDLAGQRPSLFRKMTDNIDEFLNKMKLESLDPKKPEDKAMLEYLQYMENLKQIFKEASYEYQSKGFEAFEQVGSETKMQRAIKEALKFDIETYDVFIPEQERLNDASYTNFILATTLKPLERDVKLTFNLSEDDMNEIYETLYEMNSFENNAVNQLFDIINSQMDGRFDYLIEDTGDDVTIAQLETLAKFLVQSKQYFNNRRWMDEIIRDTNEKFIEKRKVESIELSDDYTIEEWRLHFARQEALKFMQNNPAVLIGSGGSKDLIVLHNTTEEKLLKTIALGGFPMPSLAVTRAKYAHSSFGDITIVFNKDILENSPTFTADAYSPRVPTINNMFVESKDIKAFESFISKYKSMDGYYYLQQYVSALKNGNMRDANSFLDEAFKLDYEIKDNVISFKTTEFYRAYYEEIFGKQFVKDFSYEGYTDTAMEKRSEKYKMMDRFLSDNGAKPYFRNDVDPYTNNGRRSPSKLYTEANLKNIVKYMSSRNKIVGAETFDDFNLRKHKALLNDVMLSTSDVQQNRRMIKKIDERDYQSFIGSRQYLLETIYREVEENALTEKFPIKDEFVYELEKYLERKTDVSKEALIKYFEPKGFLISKEILTYFSDLQDNAYGLENDNGINPYESFKTYAEYLSQVLTDVKGLSVSYFESKPRRAVMFEEIEQVLIPKNSSDELKQSLKDNDIPFIEYQKSHIFDDAYGRQPLIEAMKEYQFQLAPDFKSDSNGTELNDDQLRPIMLSRALDANGNIKLVTHNGREGYYDIRRPLDTRKRNVRSMAEDYANRYGMEFDGLFNAKDAKSFLSLANSNGYDFDGIVYKDGTEVGYVPAMDSQFFPSDSIEFTGKLLKEMKDRTGMYEDLDKQVQDAKRSADLQIIQANIDYYENGFEAYEKLNRNPEELLVTNEEFKEIYDEAIKRVEEYELENIERRNRMLVEQGMSAEYIEEFNKENLETLEEDKKNMLQEVYDNYIDSNRKPFEDDYANYMKWQDIKALHEGFAPEPFVDARGFKQYPISDYEIEQGRKRFHIPVLNQYEAQQIIDKTIENMQKTSRYAEDFEMVDPKTLILFKDYDRLSRPSYEENFKRTFDSIREKGFIEPVWITANYQTGFTYLGEGNHRVYIALMAGIDRVPAVVSRHNYDEPRLIERQGYAIGLSNGGYVDVNGIQKQDSMMKPSELSDVFSPEVQFQRALEIDHRKSFTKVRGGWTLSKIDNELKTNARSINSHKQFVLATTNFDSVEELKENIFYHGTGGYIARLSGLRPSSRISKKKDISTLGGGYGERYHTVSLSRSRNVASNFTAQSSSGTVYTVLLKKGANVISMPEVTDSIELEDMIVDLWNRGIDAVKLGDWDSESSEQEIAILNPRAIVSDDQSLSFQVYRKERIPNLTDEALQKLMDEGKSILPEVKFQKETTPEFEAFYKNNEMVDEQGNLLKVYHGTNRIFNIFDSSKNRTELNKGYQGDGFFFTASKEIAEKYAGSNRNQNIDKETFLKEVSEKYPEIYDFANDLITLGYSKGWDNLLEKYSEDGEFLAFERKLGIDLNAISDIAKYVEGYNYKADDSVEELDIDDVFGALNQQNLGIDDYVIEKMNEYGFTTPKENVKEVYLNAKNVLKTNDKEEARNAKSNGYDGVIYNGEGTVDGEPEYIVFEPNQIKRTDNLSPTSSPDIRFQRELTEEQKEFFKDSKARDEQGNLKLLYHGTPNEFNKFNIKKLGSNRNNRGIFGAGFYFTDNPNIANTYGDNLIEVYLNLKNPYIIDENTTVEDIENILQLSYLRKEKYRKMFKEVDDEGNVISGEIGVIISAISESNANDRFTNKLKKLGYDGLIYNGYDKYNNYSEYVAFDSNQIKRTNNLEPTLSKDIRFQKGFESLLTPEEQSELNELRENDRIRPFETTVRDEYRMKVLSEKEDKYVKYKKIVDVKHYDDVQNEYRKARRALNENTDDVDRKTLNSILNNVKGYRGTDRRTKVEWIFIANQYGANYNEKSQDDLLQHALMTWMVLLPYKNINKQGDNSVKFSVDEWIREVGKGAGAGQIKTSAELGGIPEIEAKRPLDFVPDGDNERIRSYAETVYDEIDGVSQKKLEDAVRDGSFTYASYSDKVAVKQGNKRISDNGAEAEFSNLKYNFLNNTMPTKSDIATAEILIKHYSKNRETEKVVELITIVADMGTQLGQAVQALSLIERLSPTGQLVSLKRIVQKMETLYSNDNTTFKIEIPNEYVDSLMEIEGKIGELNDNIAEQELLQNTIQGFIDEKTELENSLDSGIFERYEAVKQEVADIRKKINERDMLRNKIQKYETELLLHDGFAKDIDTLRIQREELEMQIKSAKKAIREGEAQEGKIAKLEAELKELQDKLPMDIIDRIEATKDSIKSIKDQLKLLKKYEDRLKSLTTKEVIDEKLENIKKAIGEQLPVTFVDQLNAWRYLSMLGNPRTHIRNILGNAGFMPTYLANDLIGSVVEKFLPKEQRTKSLRALSDPELKDFVLQLYEQDKKALESSTKYSNVTYEIDKQRRIFGWNWLENLREKNFEWLEKEDKWFSKPAYMHALGSIIKARGWDILEMTEEQTIEARKYAIDFALKATYRDASKVADDLNRLERGWGAFGKFMMASNLPFKKTLINILKRGVEYTPVSIMVGVKQLAFDVRRNDITPAQALDKITSGLTGTGIMLIGAWLFSIGVLSVGDDDDEKDRKRFYDRALGSQRYAINWDGHSYTIDWLVPTALPLILGGELARAFSKENDDTFINSLTDATLGILDPVFELSMLQGVTQTLQSYQSGAGTFADVIATASANYIGQLFPTLGGQLARIIDPVQRSTMASSTSPIGKFAEQTLRKLANKVPLLSMINAPVVNVRGEEVVNYENPFARAFMNLLSPGFYKNRTLTEQDNEILRMYDKTMDTAVIPKTLDKSFDYEKQTYYLDNRQYSDMSRILGEVSYEQLDKLFEHKGYKRIAEEDKVFMIDKMYDYAYFKAKDAILKGMGKSFESDEYNNMKKAEANGVNVIDYLLAKREFDKMSSDKFKSKQEKFIEYLKKSGYSGNMKFFMEVVGKYKYNPFGSSGGIFD